MKKTYKILSAVLAAVLFSTAFTLFPSVKKEETVYAAGNITHENSAQTARSIADEGTVLLRNTGALPLKRSDRVVMCGSEKTIFGGGGSGWVNTTEKISYSDGMTAASSAGKIRLFSVKNFGSVDGSDKVLYVISRETTENADRSRSSFYLTATEKNELSAVCSAVGSANVIVLLNVGSVVDTTWLIEKNVGAIVACYFGGSVAGESLAAVLCGEVSPSGKTSDTWAKSLGDYPSESVGTFGQQNIVKYTEDIYVGYRWFETFDKNYEKVNYEFGYGLSYTKFEISERKAEVTDGKVVASATVKNVGSYSGKEVLHVYYSAPQGEFGTPSKQLGAFVKTHTLAPGQSQTVTCSFPIENMAVFDDLGKVAVNRSVLLSGEYSFYLGNSVKNAGLAGVAGKYNQTENKVIETLSALPDSTLDFRLTASGAMEKISDAEDVAMGAITVNALGATVIQAEEYSDKSGSSSLEAYVSGTSAGKGIGNLNRNDGFLEYKLNVEKAGEYNILFAMATQYDNQIDMFTVTVDKQRQPVVASLATRTHDESDGMWFKCLPIKSSANKITLPKGECTLRFSSNGLKFQNIDFFVIYNDNVGEGKAAFNATLCTSSTGVIHGADKFVTGYSGKAGNRYTFTVNAETAGEYDLSVAASNLSKASESALKVLVGDNNVGNIPLKRTSVAPDVALENNKFVCAQSDSLVVTLAKGENVITLETEDTALGCLETLYVEKADGNRIHTGNYSDNTAEFDGKTPSLEGKKLDKVITYNDVLFDPSLMDDFVSQLSVIDLIYMHGTDAKNQTGEINTGGVGGYKVTSNFKSFNAEYSNLIAAYKSRIITREQLESNVKTALKFLMLTNCNKQQVFAVDESIEISAANTAASSVGDGKLKRMYRFYIRNEGKYSLDVVGLKEGVAVTLDGAEISGKTDNVTMSLGLHELIVSGDIKSVNALEKLVINAAFCSGDRHSWGEWQVIKSETCVQPGTKERVCSVCGKTESEEIAPNGKHNYENGRCTVCSALQPGASHEHIFGEWTVVKQATCLEKGERTRVCDCGARETESTPLALHDYKDGVCSVCGNKKPGGGENNSVPTVGCRSADNTLPAMLIVCAMLVIAYLPMRKK